MRLLPALFLLLVSCGDIALPNQKGPDAGALGVEGQDAGPVGEDAGPDGDAGPPGGDAGPAADAGPLSGIYGGRCDTPFPEIFPAENWRHVANRELVSGLTVLHRAIDAIATVDQNVQLSGKFAYGPTDKDLEDEWVELWIRRCPYWQHIGVFLTGEDFLTGEGGWARTTIAAGSYPPGDYRVRWVVQADGTWAEGTLSIWRPGMKVVVTDIDGTLTTDDSQAITDVLGGGTAAMYPDADKVMQAYAQKDYRLIYLSARPAALERYTRKWLLEKGFPWGIVRVTNTLISTTLSSSATEAFKTDFLNDLVQGVGVIYVRAYGNAETDIGAYENAGIPKSDTFIIGEHAGKRGTQPLSSYTAHLPAAQAYPDAVQP